MIERLGTKEPLDRIERAGRRVFEIRQAEVWRVVLSLNGRAVSTEYQGATPK